MKKIISLALTLIVILSCTVLSISAATSSPEIKDIISSVEVVDANGAKVEVKLEKTDVADPDFKPESTDEKIMTQVKVGMGSTQKYPLSLTVKIDGVKTTSKVYVLAKDEAGAVKKLDTKVLSNGVISFTFDKYYAYVAFVADLKTATQVGTSDKTGDFTVPAIACAMLTSAVAIVYSKKKLEKN
ncbi:MAG: hypothetical protein IJO62_04920 [Clostridia bacterium]|nr:hypothetical protein [Clostridia bacterium]